MDLNINLNSVKEPKIVPNQLPLKLNEPCKIAIIGEAPGEAEEEMGQPFVGPSGQLLDRMLTQAGIHRAQCLVANICQERPHNNNISNFNWNDHQIQNGLTQLKADLDKCRPNLCILLGSTALSAAGFTNGETITEWRGSILKSSDIQSPLFGYKCIPTYHPAAVLRQWNWMPLMLHDIFRAKTESTSPDLNLPDRKFDINLTATQIESKLEEFRAAKKPVALDIEGYTHNITCVSFSNDPLYAFIVPLTWSNRADLHRVLKALARFLGDPEVPKVLQNSLYDNLALSITYGMVIRNVVDDTMLAGWEAYPELPKGLGTLASLYTRQPAYKFMRKTDDQETHYRYCCIDSAVTLEIAQTLNKELSPAALKHYRFHVELLKPFLYLELRGMKFDQARADQMKQDILVEMSEVQKRLDTRLGYSINLNSPKQVCDALYKRLNFPVQHPKKKVGHGLDRTRQTSDVNALLKLCGQFQDTFLTDLLLFRKLEKTRQFLELNIDDDGRCRCSYNVVGTETGRVSSSAQTRVNKEWKIGTNMQTATKPLRVLLTADPGFEFFQADLAGADGWTVAAQCKSLGDPTMMDDYLFGLKPAKIVVLMQRYGQEVNTWSREKIKAESKDINEEGPDGASYFAAKVIQHGTSYKMGPGTMASNITLQAYKKRGKPLYVSRTQCAIIQELFFSRYPGIKRWHSQVAYTINNTRGYPTLPCASGHIRTFFGRPNNDATVRSALSHEPQANTTYATNLALYKLWADPENRHPNGSPIIEPLHQVHDAVCGQWPIEHRDWAIAKIKSYFDNPLTIAGHTMVIPFDGQYGPSWGELKNEFK